MIRKYLVAGIFTLLPLVVTLYLLKAIFDGLTTVYRGPAVWVSRQLGLPTPPWWELALASAVTTLVLLVLVGLLMGNFVGRQMLSWMDEAMLHVPVVKGIYGATKQLLNAVQSGHGGTFKEVVLVEWPCAGTWTLGFVARRDCAWAMADRPLVAVYVPTAPNPTSGYVVMVDPARLRPTDLTPDQALTWAISAGVVAPAPPPAP